MKRLITPLVVLAVLLGGYYFFWDKKADEAEKKLLAHIEENKSATSQFKYEKITRQGFPFNVTLKFHNPTFENQTEEEHDLWHLDGILALSRSIFGGDDVLQLNGALKRKLDSSDGSSLELSWNGAMYDKKSSDDSFESIKNAFDLAKSTHSLDLDIKDLTLSYKDPAKKMSDPLVLNVIGPSHARIDTKTTDSNDLEVNFNLNFKNIKALNVPAKDSATPLEKLFSFEHDDISEGFTADGSLQLPLDEKGQLVSKIEDMGKAHIKINQYNAKNVFASFKLDNFLLDYVKDNDMIDIKLNYDFELSFTPKWDDYFNDKLNKLFSDPAYLDELTSNDAKTTAFLEENKKQILELFPQLSKWGVIKNKMDLFVKGPQGGDKAGKESFVKLKEYLLEIEPYQTKLTIDLHTYGQNEGNVKTVFSQTNYKDLIHNFVNFYSKIQSLVNAKKAKTGTGEELPAITDAQVNLVTDFLNTISDSPKEDNKDLYITVTGDKEGYKIGTLDAQELANVWNSFVSKLRE